jgi:hypothetical protein
MPRNIIFPLERLLLLFHDRLALRQVFPGPCLQNRRGIDAVVVYTRQTRSKPPSAIERSLSVIKVQDSTCNLKFEHAKENIVHIHAAEEEDRRKSIWKVSCPTDWRWADLIR